MPGGGRLLILFQKKGNTQDFFIGTAEVSTTLPQILSKTLEFTELPTCPECRPTQLQAANSELDPDS